MKRIFSILFALMVALSLILVPAVVSADPGTFTFTAGVDDDFNPDPPIESTSPSADLLAFMDPYGWGDRDQYPHRQFDDLHRDRVFGHTFTNLPPCIVAATLEIHMRGGWYDAFNDALWLELTDINKFDPASYWGIMLTDLEPGWTLGSDQTFILDLANLPPGLQGPTNIIPFMNADHALDVYVQDDTGVDYMVLTVETTRCVVDVDIDIKPGSDPNSINPKSKGVIPVAILTTADFDATTVDAETVRFGPAEAEPVHWALEDVDGDGDIDMVLQFKTQDTGIAPGDTSATLTGETYDGTPFAGTDTVRTVGK